MSTFESNDEVIYVSPNQNVLSIKHLLFELISLSIPNKRRHQKNKNGVTGCNQDMINLIDEYNTIKKETFDPRWNALKELK